jgi:hypothetical protein
MFHFETCQRENLGAEDEGCCFVGINDGDSPLGETWVEVAAVHGTKEVTWA